RIHPPADQHGGHEGGAGGRLVCPRLGLAADFVVPGTDSHEVARWIGERTASHRPYLYEPHRPINVSARPDAWRLIVHTRRRPAGRRVPRRVDASLFG